MSKLNYVKSNIMMSAPLTYLINVFGFLTESKILIDSEGLGFRIPLAGIALSVPMNLWGSCYDSACIRIISFLIFS
jgi:hypothetical protein